MENNKVKIVFLGTGEFGTTILQGLIENEYKNHVSLRSTEPCNTCTKLILSTGCWRVVFIKPYPSTLSRLLWNQTRVPEHWVHYTQERKNVKTSKREKRKNGSSK